MNVEQFLKFVPFIAVIVTIVATITTLTVGWIKDRFFDRDKHKRSLYEKQIERVYNKLLSLYLEYRHTLVIRRDGGEAALGDEEVVTNSNLVIENMESWKIVMDKTQEVVMENLYLLEHKDFIKWNEFLNLNSRDIESEDELQELYNSFKEFLVECMKSYIKIQNRYRLASGEYKKRKKKEIEQDIKRVQGNFFMKKQSQDLKVKKLKRNKKEIKDFI